MVSLFNTFVSAFKIVEKFANDEFIRNCLKAKAIIYIKKIAAKRYTNQKIVDPIFYLLLFFVIHNYKSMKW